MSSKLTTDIENLCELFDQQTDLTGEESDVTINSSDQRRPLNVSTLAHYFGLQCDEYLRLSLNLSIERKTTNNSLRNQLTLERGIQFESRLKEHFSPFILSDIHDETEFLSYLRSSISKAEEFRIGYNIKFRWTFNKLLQSHYKPDFLLIKHRNENDERLEMTIADAKSSLAMGIDHCIQVTLYAIDLRLWIERNHLDEKIFINDLGEIWLPSDDENIPYDRKTFPMGKLRIRLEHFLRNDLEKILSGSSWMVLPRCSLCSFKSICRQRAIREDRYSLNNLSYLTRSSHSLIRSMFHCTSLRSIDIERLLQDSTSDDLLQSDEKLKLQKLLAINDQTRTSATINALKTRRPQLKCQSSFLIAKSTENLSLLFFSLISNPSKLHSLSLFAFNIYRSTTRTWFHSNSIVKTLPTPSDVVAMVSRSLQELKEENWNPCQIVLFDEKERNLLFEQLILGSDHQEIDQCLILLTSSENAILLDYPPDVIEKDRFFRSHQLTNLKKDQIQEELNRFYPSESSKTPNKTKPELTEQLKQLNEKVQDNARKNLLGLPYLISLHAVIRQSFVVPTPGYFDLEDLKSSFQIATPSPTIDQLLNSIDSSDLNQLVQQRIFVLSSLYFLIQQYFNAFEHLQFDALPLPNIHPISSSHPHIRRLIFLRQYELLHSIRSFQQARFDKNESPIAIRIREKIPLDRYKCLWKCTIERGEDFISKNFVETMKATNDFHTYPYLIFKHFSSIRTFSDAHFMDSAIDGIRSTTKFDQYGFAHVEQCEGNDESLIFIRVKGTRLPLQIGEQYGLTERHIDFNTKKAIRSLEKATPLTIQILDDPRQLDKPRAIHQTSAILQQEISNMFSKREATLRPDRLHLLNRAQQDACEKVKSQRITLIWGPPGTGKTYWSSVTVFQMLMFAKSPLRILITACTHTAIDNLLFSINHLKEQFVSSPQFPQWHNLAKELNVLKLDTKSISGFTSLCGKAPIVAGSTVWTLNKLDPSIYFDIIFVDEATQLLTSDAVLALNRLADHRESRLIVAGDPLQLPPVKRCQYPPLPEEIPDLFSSLFHCLLRDPNNHSISLESEKPFEDIARCPYLSIFNENHRMNDQLSDFTRLLYGQHYRPGRSKPLLSIKPLVNANRFILGSLLEPASSLYTIVVDSLLSKQYHRSEDLDVESRLVSSLIDELVQRIPLTSIFIITPHRMQRSAIKTKLSRSVSSNLSISCDTVERMQGKEAQCVILCMLYRQKEILENELDFIYNRQRINVSITRAQQLCFLLTSDLLLNRPPLELFVNRNTRNAYTLLSNYVNRSTLRFLTDTGNIKN